MKGELVPQASFLLCEKLPDSNITKSGLIVTKDTKKADFAMYKVLAVGDEIEKFFSKGDVVIADSDNVNELTYQTKQYHIMSDSFVIIKVV